MNVADLEGTYWKYDLAEWAELDDLDILYFKYLGPHAHAHQHLLLGCDGKTTYTLDADFNSMLQLITDPDEKGMVALMFIDVYDGPDITWKSTKHIKRRP